MGTCQSRLSLKAVAGWTQGGDRLELLDRTAGGGG